MARIMSRSFYNEYHGHRIEHLDRVVAGLRPRPLLFLLGDSSLDNKYWILHEEQQPACNGYEALLRPPQCVPDVAYWLNRECVEQQLRAAAVNGSIEESTIGARRNHLLPQDEFVRDNMTADDVLIVSMGGNDVALAPTFGTIVNTLWLAYASTNHNIDSGAAWGLGHYIRLMRTQVASFLRRLTEKTKPKAIVVCMIYFPDSTQSPENRSWADTPLRLLGYFRNPERLQRVIRKVFELGTALLSEELPELNIIPFPLFEVLDGSNPSDYTQKVEPSVTGGHKMAQGLLRVLREKGLVD